MGSAVTATLLPVWETSMKSMLLDMYGDVLPDGVGVQCCLHLHA